MEHLNGNIGASYRTKGTSGAFTLLALFFFSVLGRMITLDVEPFAYLDLSLGARCNTQPTPLAQFCVNPYKSLLQTSISYAIL